MVRELHVCGNICLNHFCTSGHCSFLEDVSLTILDKTDPSDPLKREDYWRSALKTMASFRPKEESVSQFYYRYLEHLYFYRTGTF